MRLTSDQLTIYLHDHLAGAMFGAELANRARRQNETTRYGAFLAGLAEEVSEDREELQSIMARLDVGRDELKMLLAWTGEKVGRLKPNGRLSGHAPLSRVLELEGLTAGVRAKLALWLALRALAPNEPKLEVNVLDGLIDRAESQLDGLRERHVEAVVEAFAHHN